MWKYAYYQFFGEVPHSRQRYLFITLQFVNVESYFHSFLQDQRVPKKLVLTADLLRSNSFK